MKLHLKFVEPILDYNENNIDITDAILACEEEAEKFAIDFALWKETIRQDENGMYYSASRAQISEKNPVNIQKLLEIYKKQRE
jgi:hypothetical protein